MVTTMPSSSAARGAAFALWLLAVGSAVFWGLRLSSGAQPVRATVGVARPAPAVDPAAVARFLGGSGAAAVAAAPSLASRFALVGVVAGERSGGGAAVIAVDGKPAKPFRVGSQVEEGLILQSVKGRTAVLAADAAGPPTLTLELPARK